MDNNITNTQPDAIRSTLVHITCFFHQRKATLWCTPHTHPHKVLWDQLCKPPLLQLNYCNILILDLYFNKFASDNLVLIQLSMSWFYREITCLEILPLLLATYFRYCKIVLHCLSLPKSTVQISIDRARPATVFCEPEPRFFLSFFLPLDVVNNRTTARVGRTTFRKNASILVSVCIGGNRRWQVWNCSWPSSPLRPSSPLTRSTTPSRVYSTFWRP